MSANDLSGRRVLVLGLGETGLSMARYLDRRGARLRLADTREEPPALDALGRAMPHAEVALGRFEERLLEGVDMVALSPGLPLAGPLPSAAAARGIEIVGDVELFARALPAHAKVIAITGTNGKTTVTALTGAMVRAAGIDCEVAGNISPAVLDALMAREDDNSVPDAWVLELSSFQLETTASLAPVAATVLNLTEDHLDRYADMAAYAAAKARIFAGGGVQVLNREDAHSRAMAVPGRRVVTFGLDTPVSNDDFGLLKVRGEWWLARDTTPLLGVAEMRLEGLHNAANALASIALAREVGVPCAAALGTLRTFRGLPHRVERVGDRNGVAFYDDSKGTNVGSTVAALSGFARQQAGSGARVVLIAGGDGKQQDFTPLAAACAAATRAVVLIGRDAPQIERALAGSGAVVVAAASMEDAVERAAGIARPGDAVLLSPACASFDMFRNYRHRGEVFRAAVERLGEHAPH
jgi:UDP-N-acetylmuramoylalanine--D-glutamate ligase